MAVLGIFGKSKGNSLTERVSPAVCLHPVVLPRWNSVSEMGQEDKVSGYACQSCGESFSAEDGQSLRAHETERIRKLAGTNN